MQKSAFTVQNLVQNRCGTNAVKIWKTPAGIYIFVSQLRSGNPLKDGSTSNESIGLVRFTENGKPKEVKKKT